MKKFYLIPLLSIFLIAGCSKDDDTPVDPDPVEENPDEENPNEENPDENGDYIIPADLTAYYEGVDFSLVDEALYDELAAHTISKHSNFLSYGERHQYLYDADADPSNPDNVILLYSGESRDAREWVSGNNPHGTQTFNTEHIYPQSLLTDDHRESDLHVLRVADAAINGQRSNHPYTDGEGQYELINGNSFYPGDEWRGDVARIVMYMNIHYDEPFEDVGNLDLFLEWNAEDPVSVLEMQRNNVIEGAQGNRNPFIDNPHLATAIWGGTAADNRWDGNNEDEDSEAPSAPTAVSVSDASFETLTLSWDAASDNVAVTKYSIYADGTYLATSTSTSIELQELTPGTTYSFTVTASDAYGNESEASEAVEGTTLTDSEAPSVPSNLTAPAVYATSVSLDWDASTDNAGIKNYDVYVDGEFSKTVYDATDYTVGGLSANTTYTFSVLANDIYGNSSALTEAISVTTLEESEGGSSDGVLLFTEYTEGSSFNKALEIGNISDVPVDLTAYTVRAANNGATEWIHTLQLEGTLLPGEVIVLAHGSAELPEIMGENADYIDSKVINFNGDDAMGLFKNGELVDLMGVFGERPEYAKDVNLRRKSTVTSPSTTFDAAEWDEFPKDTVENFGQL